MTTGVVTSALGAVTSKVLRIGPLPSADELTQFAANGISGLVNVSGVDLDELYPRQPRPHTEQFYFSDVFSRVPALSPETEETLPVNTDAYLIVADAEERAAYLAAVRALSARLNSAEPTYLFCHRGRGRSPAVAAAALSLACSADAAAAWAAVRVAAPRAHCSPISLAAQAWALDQIDSLSLGTEPC